MVFVSKYKNYIFHSYNHIIFYHAFIIFIYMTKMSFKVIEKRSLNSDGQQLGQHQQGEQLPLTLTH